METAKCRCDNAIKYLFCYPYLPHKAGHKSNTQYRVEHLNKEKDITVCQSEMISNAILTIKNFLSEDNIEKWTNIFF